MRIAATTVTVFIALIVVSSLSMVIKREAEAVAVGQMTHWAERVGGGVRYDVMAREIDSPADELCEEGAHAKCAAKVAVAMG
jgi:hypothetical protein